MEIGLHTTADIGIGCIALVCIKYQGQIDGHQITAVTLCNSLREYKVACEIVHARNAAAACGHIGV